MADSIWGDDWLGDRILTGGRQDEQRTRSNVSVGLGSLPPWVRIVSGAIIPNLVPRTPPPPPAILPPTITGGEEPYLPPTKDPAVENVSWSDWMAAGNPLPADWSQYPHASDHPGVSSQAEGLVTGEDDVGILGDIYDAVDTRLGGILPGGVPFGTSVFDALGNQTQPGAGAVPITQGVTYGQTVVGPPPMTAGGCAEDPYRGMVYKRVCGQFKWVKQKRRRRRSLATHGDIKAIAALKGVLGGGKALETWIATHS